MTYEIRIFTQILVITLQADFDPFTDLSALLADFWQAIDTISHTQSAPYKVVAIYHLNDLSFTLDELRYIVVTAFSDLPHETTPPLEAIYNFAVTADERKIRLYRAVMGLLNLFGGSMSLYRTTEEALAAAEKITAP